MVLAGHARAFRASSHGRPIGFRFGESLGRNSTRVRPFRVTLTNGEEFDIRRPEMVRSWGGMVYLPRETARPADPQEGATVMAAPTQVLKVENLTDAAAPPVDRPTV